MPERNVTYGELLIASNFPKLGADFFHLVCKCTLWTAEHFRDLAVRDTFGVVRPKLNDVIGVRVELAKTSEKLLQKHAANDNIFHARGAIWQIIVHIAIAICGWFVKGKHVPGSVVFAVKTIAVTLPDIVVRTHAAVVMLLPISDTPDFRIKGVVLFFCNRNECDL